MLWFYDWMPPEKEGLHGASQSLPKIVLLQDTNIFCKTLIISKIGVFYIYIWEQWVIYYWSIFALSKLILANANDLIKKNL